MTLTTNDRSSESVLLRYQSVLKTVVSESTTRLVVGLFKIIFEISFITFVNKYCVIRSISRYM